MTWTRSHTLALAQQDCVLCLGHGLRHSELAVTSTPCLCVGRAIFRICFQRFKRCTETWSISKVVLGRNESARHSGSYGRKNEEYAADFILLAKRTLGARSRRYKIFRLHCLLGADYQFCCAELKIERGEFFHEVYRIQAAIGFACRELQPYALFPVDEYFTGSRLAERVGHAPSPTMRSMAVARRPSPTPMRPPLAVQGARAA